MILPTNTVCWLWSIIPTVQHKQVWAWWTTLGGLTILYTQNYITIQNISCQQTHLTWLIIIDKNISALSKIHVKYNLILYIDHKKTAKCQLTDIENATPNIKYLDNKDSEPGFFFNFVKAYSIILQIKPLRTTCFVFSKFCFCIYKNLAYVCVGIQWFWLFESSHKIDSLNVSFS